jgi:transglutaminase-like putative cysteine protease
VADAIAYRPGVTHAHTTAAEALALGEGVCQDHAHALIACARVRGHAGALCLGLSFRRPPTAPRMRPPMPGPRLHVPGLGWVGFDPANRCCPDDRYIRLGSGFDAQDAAPIRGIAAAGRAKAMDVTVAVEQSAQ